MLTWYLLCCCLPIPPNRRPSKFLGLLPSGVRFPLSVCLPVRQLSMFFVPPANASIKLTEKPWTTLDRETTRHRHRHCSENVFVDEKTLPAFNTSQLLCSLPSPLSLSDSYTYIYVDLYICLSNSVFLTRHDHSSFHHSVLIVFVFITKHISKGRPLMGRRPIRIRRVDRLLSFGATNKLKMDFRWLLNGMHWEKQAITAENVDVERFSNF